MFVRLLPRSGNTLYPNAFRFATIRTKTDEPIGIGTARACLTVRYRTDVQNIPRIFPHRDVDLTDKTKRPTCTQPILEHTDIESPQRTRWATIAATCRGILGAIPAAAYACDGLGHITYFNPIAEAVWGRAPRLRDGGERFCGSHQLYSTDGVRIRHEECWMALALLQGRAYHGHAIVIERPDGTRTIGKAHAHPLRNNQDQIVGALNLVADITGLGGAEAGHSKSHEVSRACSGTVAMIDIAVSVLTAIKW